MRLRHPAGRMLHADVSPSLTLLTCSLALSLSAVPAQAVDVRLLADVFENLSFDDNLSTAQESRGEVTTTATSVNVHGILSTPRSTLGLRTGTTLRKSFGPGAESSLNTLDPRLSGNYRYRGPDYSVGLNGSFSVANTRFSEVEPADFGAGDTDTGDSGGNDPGTGPDPIGDFDQTIVTQGTTQRIAYSVGANLSIDVNRADKASAFVQMSTIDFAKSVTGLVPSDRFSFGGSWNTAFTPLTSGDLSATMSFFSSTTTDSKTISLSAGISTQLLPNLSANVGGGVDITNSDRLVGGARQSQTTVGGSFDLGLNYVLGLTSFAIYLSQNLAPTDEGDLRQRTGVNASMNHRINSVSSFSLAAYYAIQEATSSTATTASSNRTSAGFSVHYSHRLDAYWNLGLGYNLRYRGSDTGNGISNRVFGTLSRQFVLVP